MTSTMPVDEQACVGVMIGTFVGDALGAPVEGWGPERIEREHGRLDEMLPKRGAPGRYTDDTQMMIALAEGILEAEGIDAGVIARRMLDLHDPSRGYGQGTTRVLQKWRQGVPVDQAARQIFDEGSFGNGGSMRIASVAAAYHTDLDGLRDAARASCEITHAHPLGIAGAQLQARAIAEAIRATPEAVDPIPMLERIRRGVSSGLDDGTYERAMDEVEGLLEQSTPPEPQRIANRLGNDSRAFASVPTAIYAALSSLDSFEDALVNAVAVGGDTDTIGAMAGAISGGLHGTNAVPERWWNQLENASRGRDHVVELGEQIAVFAAR